jgi:hypothetical protein
MNNISGLIDKIITDDGLENEYEEFTNSSFNNIFVPLETIADNSEINKKSQEETMKGTRKASYIGQLSSGFDATVQDDYNAGQGAAGQEGKGHEEEVAKNDNWGNDKRDAVGKAASVQLRRTAAKLNKLADMLDNQEVTDDIDDIDDDLEEQEINNMDNSDMTDLDDIVDCDDCIDDDISEEEYNELIENVASDCGTKKSAAHPLERKDDSPKSEMSAQTGDEWIDIGPGEFSDKRDDVGRAK